MKKYIMLVAAALIFAACVKEEVNIPTGETEFISVELNVATKTILSDFETNWLNGDKVSVTGEESKLHLGYLTYDSGTGRFSGNITAGQKGNVTLNYPVDDQNKAVTSVPTTQVATATTFAEGAALLQGTITVEELRAGKGTTLNNTTALLQFTVAQAGDVTFEVGGTKYTVTGCMTGSTYYACVAPATNVSFVARIGGYLSKNASTNKTFTANKIANLGELPAPVDAKWRLKGAFDWSTGKTFYKDLNGYIVVKNVTFDSTTEFKAHNQDGKDEWARAAANVVLDNQWYKIGTYDGGNSRVIKGTYDIYVDPKGYNIYFITAGDKLTAPIPTTRTVTVYLNSTSYTHLWCWNKDNNSENFTGGSWPGKNSTTNEVINGKTYRKWVLNSSNIGAYTNMIFSKNGSSQTGEDGNTGLLMGETMFVKLEGGKTRFNNDI